MRISKLILTTFLLPLLFSCHSKPVSLNQTGDFFAPEVQVNNVGQQSRENKYLCVSLNTGGGEIVKVLNLQTKEMISLPIPGFVRGMSAATEENIIYVNAASSDENYYSLYRLNLNTKKVERILSFSQLGIKPSYFMVEKNNVYVTGKRGNAGVFYGNDLDTNQWFAVANNVSPGKIEPGFTENSSHIVSFDDDYVTRTIVDIPKKQITGRKTIKHSVPFGNNVFIPSPHGSFVYVLHQLKDSFIPYAFNLRQGTENKFEEIQTKGGLLYSALVSNNGKHLFTNVNSEIYHYLLDGDKLISLPKVLLKIPESRNMAMTNDNLTLYVTHDSGANLSVVRFAPDYKTYTLNTYHIGGSSNEIYLF